MSDDPQPPRSRPKLRLVPEPGAAEPAAPPPPPPAPETPADADAGDGLRLRLKPKKAPVAPRPVVDLFAPPPAPPPAGDQPLEEPEPHVDEPEPAAPPARLKLAPPPPVEADPLMPLPPKGVDLPVAAPSPKTPFVRAAPDVPEATYLPPAAQATPVYKADRWLAGIVLLCVVVGAGFYGVRYYLKRPQTPAPVSSTAADTSASSAPSSLPGKAIAQTRDAAAVHDAIAQDVDRVIDEAAGDANATSSENLAATARADLPPPEPTEEFRNFVTSLKVSGVFQGEPSRALLNGKMYGVGQIVDETLGISFAGVEPESKNLVFKDSDGAVVKRRY